MDRLKATGINSSERCHDDSKFMPKSVCSADGSGVVSTCHDISHSMSFQIAMTTKKLCHEVAVLLNSVAWHLFAARSTSPSFA